MLQVKMQWQAGYKSAMCRDKGDETMAMSNYNWSQKAMSLSEDRPAEQLAFDKGYKMYHKGFSIFDNPY